MAAIVAWGYATPAFAQYTWTGGGSTPYYWTDTLNWSGGNTPVSSSTTTLTFAGAAGLSNTNNYTSPFQLSTLTFSSTAGAFNIQGTSALQFASGGSIVNNTASTVQTINVPIQTTGPLTLSGTGSFSLPNAISGTGSLSIAMSGTAIVTMSVPASYTGPTMLQTGTLSLGGNNVLPVTSPLLIGSTAGSTGMSFNMSGFSQTILGLTIYAPSASGNTVISNGVRLTDNGNIGLANNTSSPGGGYSATISGGLLDLNGGIRTITVAGQDHGPTPGDLILDIVVTDGGFIFTGNPSISGSASNAPTGMTLGATSANTYAGGTTVNAGTLNVAATTTLGTGGLTIAQSGSTLSAVVLNSSMTIASLATGTIASSADATLTINNSGSVLTVNQTSTTTFAGVIAGVGGLTKTGAGSLTLTGTNTYTGTTNVSGGTLAVGTGGVLAAGSTVNVNSSGTLAGSGTVNGLLTVLSGGTISGGNSGVGTLTLTGAVTISAGSTIGVTISNGSTPSSTPGGSTVGTLPNPTSNNFLNLTGLSVSIYTGALISINGTGITFAASSPYSYEIAKVDNVNLSTLDITTQSQFTTTGFTANNFSLTGDSSGDVFLNFTPTTPEPGAVLLIGSAGAGIVGFVRRRRNRGQG